MLVTGDTGCVDFWDKKAKQYYPKLINAVNDLHVAQVAHHAGNNHRFYDVLEQSGFAGGSVPGSYLLLSHADQDKYRPSPAFGTFISNISSGSGSFELLTTSQPDSAKIAAYRQYYHFATSTAQNVGDVRLFFQYGTWKIDQHLVQV